MSVAAKRARKTRTSTALRERAAEVYDRLRDEYPDAHCELVHEDAFQLLCATILSAQCTDRRVNMVTPALFAAYPGAHSLAGASPAHVEEFVRTAGFFRAKTRSLIGMASALVKNHGGQVPDDMASLTKLPGVGRKTANVILGNAFGRNDGVVVDTHVARLSMRLGFTRHTDPMKIETALASIFPAQRWTMLSHLLISHGRNVCVARKPICMECVVRELCPVGRAVMRSTKAR